MRILNYSILKGNDIDVVTNANCEFLSMSSRMSPTSMSESRGVVKRDTPCILSEATRCNNQTFDLYFFIDHIMKIEELKKNLVERWGWVYSGVFWTNQILNWVLNRYLELKKEKKTEWVKPVSSADLEDYDDWFQVCEELFVQAIKDTFDNIGFMNRTFFKKD